MVGPSPSRRDAFDVAIVGLGAAGGAAAYHLARRGLSVAGFDRFDPPHTHGSSHGESRIIREAYWEDPLYVPLVQRAYELWSDLERQSGRTLLRPTGGVFFGVPDGVVVPGCRRSAQRFGLAHSTPNLDDARRRFPQFLPRGGMECFVEPRTAVLDPEACVKAHLDGARRAGATLRTNTPVTHWHASENGVRLTTAAGELAAERLIVAAGPWSWPQWQVHEVPEVASRPLTVERQVHLWFSPALPGPFAFGSCPVFAFEWEREHLLYGFPDFGRGVKVALHHLGEAADPDDVRPPDARDEDSVRRLLREFAPGLDAAATRAATCLYTNTADGHFVIDRHPRHDNVLLASPCSGHGFKFASAMGEVLAELATKGQSRFDLRLFSLARLSTAGTSS